MPVTSSGARLPWNSIRRKADRARQRLPARIRDDLVDVRRERRLRRQPFQFRPHQLQPACVIAGSTAYATLDTAQRKAIKTALRDFCLAVVALPPERKAKYGELCQRLAKRRSKFDEGVLDAAYAWSKRVTREQLNGQPEDTPGCCQAGGYAVSYTATSERKYCRRPCFRGSRKKESLTPPPAPFSRRRCWKRASRGSPWAVIRCVPRLRAEHNVTLIVSAGCY